MTDLTGVSLFAGVGGFDLAMERNGIRVVAAVEIDKKARAVLARHFPETVLFNDVNEVTGDQLRAAGFVPERGVLTGGFPCQDLSVAGNRAGLSGARSGLFWQIIRLIRELEPRWVVLENVPGLLSSKRGRDMGVVIGALVDCGYGVTYRVLDAKHFGVPQRRRRVVIIASRRAGAPDVAGPVQILLEPESVHRDLAKGEPPWSLAPGAAADRTAGRRLASTLNSGGNDGGFRTEPGEHLVVEVAAPGASTDGEQLLGAYQQHGSNVGPMGALRKGNGHVTGGVPFVLADETPPQNPEARVVVGHAVGGQHRDDGDGDSVRPRHRIVGGDVVGTLSPGAHPGGLNGQDAYAGHLVVIDE